MDVKDLQNEATLGERNNNGSKYASSGVSLPYSRNKSYQDVSTVSLGKVDAQTSRPCAVIGPDRVLPPPVSNDTLKKNAYEAWYADSVYRHPPEYPHKMTNYHTPIRNISPRQTFQENMQRIMVPPSYNSLKGNEEHYFPMDKNVSLPKNNKPNIPLETKYCEVPYSGSLTSNEQKSVRNTEQCASNVNSVLARSVPQGWPSHVRPPRPYGAPELYQYPDYTNCAGPRPMPIARPHRTTHEDPSHGYPDPYCHDGNIRFKPYTTVKDRYPQARYEFIGNYPSPFHPPTALPPHKYDMPKSIPQTYAYPQAPLKYLDSRIPDPQIDGYQRPAQHNNYNLPFHNQMIHPAYGPVLGNSIQNKFPCPPEGSVKSVAPNKPYDTNKMYAEYENARNKGFTVNENYYFNEMQRPPHHIKSQMMPNYPVNMHGIPPHPYYRKDSSNIKNYEYMPHYRNIHPSLLSQSRIPSQFSPHAIISPPDTNLTLESTQLQGGTQEDCGYVSQSPTASIRNLEYVNRSANEFYRRYDPRYGPTIRPPPMMAKPEQNSNGNSKDKKDIDVRQFLQMWSEVDDENAENGNKEAVAQLLPNDINKATTQYETVKSQDQLYVLGLVNVPSEELGKYEHIQKVSKLPENIKGYNSIELLNQFEEVIESSNVNSFKTKSSSSRDMNYQMPMKNPVPHHSLGLLPRPVSPLDVEAKISQSVIHKEVGCNFEIKPCSPKMLNVEAATPIQNLLGERAIEKVSNPLIVSPPILHEEDKLNCKMLTRQDQIKSPNENLKNTSCKMTNTQFNNNDAVRPNYSIQDLESNSGVCLASLPRLDNDIELNFPEVNQQFINANKGESVITATKDLPSLLNIDHTENEGPKAESNLREQQENYEFPTIIDSEREFPKLSKYRKIKKCGPESLEKEKPSFSSTQNMRTDSVIIKNPDNPKMYEQNKDILTADSSAFTQDKEILNKENFVDEVQTGKEFSKKLDSSAIDTPMDIAIDFSLNKNDDNNPASSVVDYYIANPLKSPKINKIKHLPYMSRNERSDLLKDKRKGREIQQEPQQTSEDETLMENKTESKQMQETHDYHETKPDKSTIAINEKINKHSDFSMYKECYEFNEEKECKLKSQLRSESMPRNEKNKFATEKRIYNNKTYEYLKETHNVDVNTVNDNEDSNISSQVEVNNRSDIDHFKGENSSTLTSHTKDNAQMIHKSGIFQLFSDESDGYDTDSTSDETNKMQLGTTEDKDNYDKIENSAAKKDDIDNNEAKIVTIDDNHDSDIVQQIPDVKDDTKHTLKKMDTEEIIFKTDSFEKKSDIEGDAIEMNKEVKISDTVYKTDKIVENLVMEDDIKEKTEVSHVEKDLNDTVKVCEDSDIEEDMYEEKSNIKEDANEADKMEQTADIEIGDENSEIEEESCKESVKMESTLDTEEIDGGKKTTETENQETSQLNVKLPLENISQENSFYNCKTIVNDTNKVLEESDSNERFVNLETLDEISNIIKSTVIESVSNEKVFENTTGFSGNEENLCGSENKDLDNFSATTTPSTMNDSLKECETFDNATNAIQMELDCKNVSDIEENVVETRKNTHLEKLQTSTTFVSTSCDDFENDREEMLLESDYKQVSGNKLSLIECTRNEKGEQYKTNMSLPLENAIQDTTKCEDTHEQYHAYVDETKHNNASCKDSGFSQAASVKIQALAEIAHHINNPLNPNEGSNQGETLFKNSNSVTSYENTDQLTLPFKNSLTIVSPLNSDEDSSNSLLTRFDVSDEMDNLHKNDSYYHSSIHICSNESYDQNTVVSSIPSLENERAREKLEDQSSDVVKITNVNNIMAKDIDSEKCTGKNKHDFKVNLGFKKELFSPFIQKLISDNSVSYRTNVLVNTKLNHPSSSRVDNDVIKHLKRDDHTVGSRNIQMSNENSSKNIEIIFDDTISKSENRYKNVNYGSVTTKSAIILANDALGMTDVSISSPVQDIIDDAYPLKNDLCSEINENELFNNHTKLTDHSNKFTSNETKLTNNTILVENSLHTEISVASPNSKLNSNSDTENNGHFESNGISYGHPDRPLHENATEGILMDDTQLNEESTANNELSYEGPLNVKASQDLENNKCILGPNRSRLKRSLSDSALDSFKESDDAFYSGWQPKRTKNKLRNIVEHDIILESNCQSHRRKSISSVYNEQNVSFCILIDNDCIITEEEESEEQDEICYTEISEGCTTDMQESVNEYNNDFFSPNIVGCPEETNPEYSVTQDIEGKSFEESWVDDVGCIETVVSDVAEDITISASSSPERMHSPENEESGIFMNSEHTDKVKHIYGDKMCNNDIMFLETLYRTPQMNVNKVINRESQISDECIQYYNKDSLEKVLSGCHSHEDLRSDLEPLASDANSFNPIDSAQDTNMQREEEIDTISVSPTEDYFPMRGTCNDNENGNDESLIVTPNKTQDDTVHSCESSIDNVFSYNQRDEYTTYTSSTSPEVSSTTSEERNSGILLKITNYKGSRISQINDFEQETKNISCKFTESNDYSSSQNFKSNRPLITKAAQKYIPPLKETFGDLKIRLPLPQHSLLRLKQLKLLKEESKLNKCNVKSKPDIPKKPKPKFEDVLKSIDEIQFKMHKEKSKKTKKSIPKVVIKKNENGSHYASTTNREPFNPDLTGRKWQPWVFLEKNHFIDKMALRNKRKAIFNHRKNTYVLAEKFRKYKSIGNAKFIISQPNVHNSSIGHLKCTIRLKHTY